MVQVEIASFTHPNVTVAVGTTVVWVNMDRVQHTSTSGAGPGDLSDVWRSGDIRENQTFDFTFNEVGEFPYFCELHPSMQATVTVLESVDSASGGAALETPSDGGSYDYD